MRDVVTFSSERRDGRLVAVCRGFDTHGRPVEFVMDPLAMLTNVTSMQQFLHELVALARILAAYIVSGFSPDNAWKVIESMLPRPVQLRTVLDQAS